MLRATECSLFLLIIWLTVNVGADDCGKVFSADVSEDSGSIGHYSDCTIEILPNLTHAMRFWSQAHYYNNPMKAWQTYYVKNETRSVFLGEYTSNSVEFVVQANTGLNINLHRRNSDSTFRFTRFIQETELCGKVENTVDGTLREIQSSNLKATSRKCLYHLTHESNNNETLFLFFNSTSSHSKNFFVDENKHKTIDSNFVKIDNWSSVDFYSELRGDKLGRMTGIKAISLENTCECGPNNYVLSPNTTSIAIRTPSIPQFACPGLKCVSEIDLKLGNSTTGYIQKVLVTTRSEDSDDTHVLFATANSYFTLRGTFPPAFLLKTEKLTAIYETPKRFSKGFLEMNISTVQVHTDCECSSFFEKKYTMSYVAKIKIPAHCELMFCHWNAEISHAIEDSNAYLVKLSMNGVGPEDRVEVFGMGVYETYVSDELKWPRALHVIDSQSTNIIFWRKAIGPEAMLEVSWKVVQKSYAAVGRTFELTGTPKTIVSPQYPYNHGNRLNLEYKLQAPENETVVLHLEELDVEKIHDYFIVHDGPFENSTELKYLTGQKRNLTFQSSGQYLLVKFVSDIHVSGRGFHMNAFAVSPEQSTDIIAALPDTRPSTYASAALERPSLTAKLLLFLFVVILIALIILGLYLRRPELFKLDRIKGADNPMVRFRSQDDDVSVSISM